MSEQVPSNNLDTECPKKVWKMDLYRIQTEAPRPKVIHRDSNLILDDCPECYSTEYHGVLSHKEAAELFQDESEGAFLVRKSPKRGPEAHQSEFYSLSFKLFQKVHHFKLYYNPFLGFYVLEDSKTFEKVEDLVADGLLSMYMKKHAKPILDQMMNQSESEYHQSPYMTLNRRKLRALSTELNIGHHYHNKKEVDEAKRSTLALIQHEKIKESEQRIEEPLPAEYKKAHNFKVHNFKGLNWCELCANFLWGFSAQGVKCEDCGFIAHAKCSEKVPPKCVPDLKRVRGVFGIDLTTVVIIHKQEIPFVIEKCVKEIEERGMLQEGIYRISGFADEIEQVKETLDKEGVNANMSEARVSNINVVASILKLYLRLLPIPLITFQAYPTLIDASNKATHPEQVEAAQLALPLLPPAHLKCLKYILSHLNKVASHQVVNKMTEHNLGTVFAPTLIAFPSGLTDLSQEIFLLSFLIKNYKDIFN